MVNAANCGSWRWGNALGVRFGGMTWTAETPVEQPPGDIDFVDYRSVIVMKLV